VNFFENVCFRTEKYKRNRVDKTIDLISNEIKNLADRGKTKLVWYHWDNNFDLSRYDVEDVIQTFLTDGFDVKNEEQFADSGWPSQLVITIDWSKGVAMEQCPQCHKYHKETCKKDGETK
jgi:hypothetical protein